MSLGITLVSIIQALLDKYGALDFNILTRIVTHPRLFETSKPLIGIDDIEEIYEEILTQIKIKRRNSRSKIRKTNAIDTSNPNISEKQPFGSQRFEEMSEMENNDYFTLRMFFENIINLPQIQVPSNNVIQNLDDCSKMQANEDTSMKPDENGDHKGGFDQDQHPTTGDPFVKGAIGNSTSRDPLNTESRDAGKDSLNYLVQKPLGGDDNVRKFETFKDKGDTASGILYDPLSELKRMVDDPSLGLKNEASNGEAALFSDRTTEPHDYIFDSSIDSSNKNNLHSEAIKEGKIRIASDPSLGLKSEAFVKETLLGSNRTTENLSDKSESIDSYYLEKLQSSEAIKEGKSRIRNDPLFAQISQASIEETLHGNDQNAENTEKVRLDIRYDKFTIDNGPSFGSETGVSVEETALGNDRTTENLGKVQRDNTEGSSLKEDINNNPLSIDNDEYTNYYLTPSTTTMKVIRKGRRLDEGQQILRCRVDGCTCNFCGRKFRFREELRQHKLEHISFVPSRAHICSKYSRRYCIVVGYNTRRVQQFKCSHCQRRFKRFGDYSRHCNEKICKRLQSYLVSPFVQQCQLDNGEKGFECLLCQESSTVYADVKFHECIISRDLPENCCEEISQSEEEDSPEDKSYKCSKCDVVFHDSNHYETHRREHELGVKYVCHVCLLSFKRLCSYKMHMADSHKDKTKARKSKD